METSEALLMNSQQITHELARMKCVNLWNFIWCTAHKYIPQTKQKKPTTETQSIASSSMKN